jgi:RimJ/RimL family protein N-acetyltransferase
MTIRFNDPHSVILIAQIAGIQYVNHLHHCVADYDANDTLKGGVIFTEYRGGSIQVHVGAFRSRWASPAMLYLTFQYPFVICKVKKLIGLVPESNIRARNLNLHLGFKIEHTVDDVFNWPDAPNGMYIMSMLRENCRFLDMKPPIIRIAPLNRTNSREIPLAMLDETRMTIQ